MRSMLPVLRPNRPRHRLPVSRARSPASSRSPSGSPRSRSTLSLAVLIIGLPVIARLGLRDALDRRARPPQRRTRLRPAGARRATAIIAALVPRARAGHPARPAGLARPRLADHALGRRLRVRRRRDHAGRRPSPAWRRCRSGTGRSPTASSSASTTPTRCRGRSSPRCSRSRSGSSPSICSAGWPASTPRWPSSCSGAASFRCVRLECRAPLAGSLSRAGIVG